MPPLWNNSASHASESDTVSRIMTRVLVTGAAGFIGFHLSRRLLERGDNVLGVDNLNAYYDVRLKEDRVAHLSKFADFSLSTTDLSDRRALERDFETYDPEIVVNLAAQAGVRYSLENPSAYIDANLVGFGNILEAVRHGNVKHLVYASSSSVYGANTDIPFSVHDNVDHPLSLYAASKKANELMAHAYSHLYGIPVTGLRFFTVYGPWGRPDMALFLFTKAILEGRSIDVYNHGNMERDFTYIDDIAEGIVRVIDKPAASNSSWSGDQPDPASSRAPYRLYNIGNSSPVGLLEMIRLVEDALGKKAEMNLLPMQPGDVAATCANVDDLVRDVGFKPSTPLAVGIDRFVEWYREYYGVSA